MLSHQLMFVIANTNFVVSQAPRCKTTQNVYQGEASAEYTSMTSKIDVDWWFLQQLSGDDGGAIYTDSNLSDKKIISEINNYYTKNNNKIPNPVTITYEQILNNNNNYNSIAYNNEPRHKVKKVKGVIVSTDPTTRDDPGTGAHAKGFFIWNSQGGIHVIHSYPQSPVKDSAEELDIIPKLLIYGDFIINAINGINIKNITHKLSSLSEFTQIGALVGPLINTTGFTEAEIAVFNETRKTFDKFDKEVFDKFIFDVNTKHWSKNKIELSKWSKVASLISNSDFSSVDFKKKDDNDCVHYNMVMNHSDSTGQYFVQTSNNNIHLNKTGYPLSKRKFNMIWDYIADYYLTNHGKNNVTWLINTMQRGGSRNRDKMAIPSPIINIVSRTDAPWSVSKFTTDGAQHSKISYLVDITGNLFCIGDLNWQGKQESRGGSAFCSKKLDYLAEYYERRVTIIADPPTTSNYNKFGPEVIPFGTAGFQLDFTTIFTDLEKKGFYEVNKIPLIEIKQLNKSSNQYESFNPKVLIDTTPTKPSVDYDIDGSFTFNYTKNITAFNSEIKEIYIPLKLKSLQPASQTFETDQKIGLFVSPILKDEIIFCNFNDLHCTYNHENHLLIKNLTFIFKMGDYKGITPTPKETSSQTRGRKMKVIFSPTISIQAPLMIIAN
ncbi:hypothetical protein DICPUDRAFT_156371 [Dictyostelium purpureum]|uniref:Uncharacterized protein n=1 Tax=Dictyostelium purpureum TaxID=5786 RepID=F0ZWE5_DICPU|nr:uncharacterized protein DICPUDRAFT_156371 [Dictyostelium purpureum]EGC31731.1 hypothetical protein DICPUDRAFT_156371 [Dictyostelium purpureum]|eukprot:XP_003291738.1 hypothetical protein DICPUDRAFT_156371 [Dictyostelium purpureum]